MSNDNSDLSAQSVTSSEDTDSNTILRKRSRHCLWIGLALLIGALLPTVTAIYPETEEPVIMFEPDYRPVSYQYEFSFLPDRKTPPLKTIFNWILIVEGIVFCAVFSKLTKSKIRGEVMILFAGLNILWLMFISGLIGMILTEAHRLAFTRIAVCVAIVLSYGSIVTSSRTLQFNPEIKTGFTMGKIGGMILLLAMILPIFPAGFGHILIAIPFMALGGSLMHILNSLMFLAFFCAIIWSSIICVKASSYDDIRIIQKKRPPRFI